MTHGDGTSLPQTPHGRTTLEDIFSYHAPEGDQPTRYAAIRQAALEFAKVIVANTEFCADQTAAIRKVREAVTTANSAVALKGRV